MTIDATEVCKRCGMPATPEHHAPPGRSSIGMGGTSDPEKEDWRVPLCRSCHEALHAKKFHLMRNGDFVSTVAPDGRVQSERALVVKEDSPDPRYWSDEKLAMMIAQALERAADMVQVVAQCAYEWQRRYGYADRWAERLVEFVRDYTGQTRGYSVRQMEYWAKEWPLFKDRPDDWKLLSGRIAHTVASDENPNEAIALATVARLDGQPVAAVVETLRERRGLEALEYCVCDACGNRHRRKT
jgi:hypothetical protein